MQKRTKAFLQVGFYLSKFGEVTNGQKYPLPPHRLQVDKWSDAYRIFYERLSEGRTILAFERSLKNTRDAFDSHYPESGRIGWREENRKPSPLSANSLIILEEFEGRDEEYVWNQIKDNSDLNIKEYKQIIDDTISFEENEKQYNSGRTEGGKKIFTSIRYERSLAARSEAVVIHGVTCKACGFNFGEFYGEWGKNYIEVHHVEDLAERKGQEIKTDPNLDLTVLCANCHRMVHRKRGITLTTEELKKKILK